MATFARTATNLIGTPAAPQSIAASATAVGSTAAYAAGVDAAILTCSVAIGSSAPATSPTVQFAYTLDGTNWANDGGPFVVPIATASTTYSYAYPIPDAAAGGRVTVTNGTANAVTAWAQASARAVS